MNILNKLLIFLIILFFSFIILNLFKDRAYLKQVLSEKENFNVLGLGTPNNEQDNLSNRLNNIPVTISSYSGTTDLPLKEYCFKSSYNSAVSGDFVSEDMIKNVLARGCRFIDLEVLIVNDIPCVSYTKDSQFLIRETKNDHADRLLLQSALSTISSNAFTSTVPNPNDPIFIHIRVKSNHSNALKLIASDIHSTLDKNSRLFTLPNNNSTPINNTNIIEHNMYDILKDSIKLTNKFNNEQIEFITEYPNFQHLNTTLEQKNTIAQHIIDNIDKPNFQTTMKNNFSEYNHKKYTLRKYNDNHFINLRGKVIDINNRQFKIPDSHIINTLLYTPDLNSDTIRKHFIPLLPDLSLDNSDISNVKLKQIMGKIVLLVDNSYIPNFNEISKCLKNDEQCYDINNYIFAKTSNKFFNKIKFNDALNSNNNTPVISDDGISNTNKIYISVPDTFSSNNIENPDIRDLIFNHGIQISCFKYYQIDDKLIVQENLFNSHQSAIVPLKRIIPELDKCNQDDFYRCYQ